MSCERCKDYKESYREAHVVPSGWCEFRNVRVRGEGSCKVQRFFELLESIAVRADVRGSLTSREDLLEILETVRVKARITVEEEKARVR